MMDTLISGFAEESRSNSHCDSIGPNRSSEITITANANCFTNKLSKFTLATFDDEGKRRMFNNFRSLKILVEYKTQIYLYV